MRRLRITILDLVSNKPTRRLYARVMNPFSAGERYLNRVWSASTDGYIDDAHRHMAKARDQFTEALDAYRELRG